jgi:hypothetical protein
MPILVILSVLVFAAALCVYEIPQMVKSKSYRDLWAFCILLALGVILAILKSLNVTISNPSDWIAWVYSPVSDMLKNYLK